MKFDDLLRAGNEAVRTQLTRGADLLLLRGDDDLIPASDDGYFPEGSMIRRVQSEHAVGLLFGPRAMTTLVLDPRVFSGTAIHAFNRKRFFLRMAHTGHVFETVFFGSKAEADAALARVHKMHESVEGVIPRNVGTWKAGTPYSAFGHEEQLWTVGSMFDAALTFYELLVAKLTDAEREQLWQDYRLFGELFGMDRSLMPATYPDFVEYWNGRINSGELCLSDDAKAMGYHLSFGLPLPLFMKPIQSIMELILKGSLPPWVREQYGLTYNLTDAARFEAVTRAIRASRLEKPMSVSRRLTKAYGKPWRGDNAYLFNMVARTERRRVLRGRTSIPGFSDLEYLKD